jgi:hypothetical protein
MSRNKVLFALNNTILHSESFDIDIDRIKVIKEVLALEFETSMNDIELIYSVVSRNDLSDFDIDKFGNIVHHEEIYYINGIKLNCDTDTLLDKMIDRKVDEVIEFIEIS